MRIVLYAILLLGIVLTRDSLRQIMMPERGVHSESSFVLAGTELAPDLVDVMVRGFSEDYPGVSVQTLPGGTHHALEALLNAEADLALTVRPPTTEEHEFFGETIGDTTLWYPIALGALALVASTEAPFDTISVRNLTDFLSGADTAPFERFYAPDPNSGLWDTFLAKLRFRPASTSAHLVFLEDGAAVRAAVSADKRSIGLESTLAPRTADRTRTLFLRGESGPARRPEFGAVGTGEYPLHHHLYVVCTPDGNREAAKFVTQLTTARGQRRIERNGFLPAQRMPREIYLTNDPIGDTP